MLSVKAKDVLARETDVLDALDFDLVVYHPYRNIDALVEVSRECSSESNEICVVYVNVQNVCCIPLCTVLDNLFFTLYSSI